MLEIYGFTRSKKNLNSTCRVSEYTYSCTFDDNGDSKLTGFIGHIYPAKNIKAMSGNKREEIRNMSIKSQQVNMKTIHSLVSKDLGYIYGEQESGPNGTKKQFLSKSAAFLRALGNDLGFKEFKVTTNPGGIAVSGDITLMGLWDEGNGLYFKIEQPLQPFDGFLYRTIKNMKDYSGGNNQWLPCSLFVGGDYEQLITTLSKLKVQTEVEHRAA